MIPVLLSGYRELQKSVNRAWHHTTFPFTVLFSTFVIALLLPGPSISYTDVVAIVFLLLISIIAPNLRENPREKPSRS